MGFILGSLIGLFSGFCLGIWGELVLIKEKAEKAKDIDELKKWL